MNHNYVLGAVNGRGVFSFYPTMTAARDDMARANGREFSGFSQPYEPMTYDEYKRRERVFWLSDPATEITEEQWTDALEVLPPMRWVQEPGFNSFLMSEMMSGTFTNQYARYGYGTTARYFSRMVDAADRDTWMKRGEMPEVAE